MLKFGVYFFYKIIFFLNISNCLFNFFKQLFMSETQDNATELFKEEFPLK